MSLTKVSEKIILNKLKNIENGNLKLVNYDGKVFQFTMDLEDYNGSGGGRIEFWFEENNYGDGKGLVFVEDKWNDEQEEYFDKLIDARKKKGYTGGVLTIKGAYSNKDSELEKDDYLNPVYQFIDCCLVIPEE